jgi:hypothetical protein
MMENQWGPIVERDQQSNGSEGFLLGALLAFRLGQDSGGGIRTHDTRLMSPLLYRLSYPATSVTGGLMPPSEPKLC